MMQCAVWDPAWTVINRVGSGMVGGADEARCNGNQLQLGIEIFDLSAIFSRQEVQRDLKGRMDMVFDMYSWN